MRPFFVLTITIFGVSIWIQFIQFIGTKFQQSKLECIKSKQSIVQFKSQWIICIRLQKQWVLFKVWLKYRKRESNQW